MAVSAPALVTSSGLKGYFQAHRTLNTYPTGAHRWGMLALTVCASTLSFYEFGFASLLPLWMPALHFTAKEFSYFLIFSVLLSGVAAMIGGPLADRHGRVVVIDICLAATLILTFSNLLMTGFWSFVVVRGLMNLSGGLMGGAITSLLRDMSPRLSRGIAIGLGVVGPACSQWLWTFIPGMTLPYFHTWQSQIWIVGTIGAIIYIPILLWLKDLSPGLRLTIVESESSATATPARAWDARLLTAKEAYRTLLSHWQIWVLVFGGVSLVTVPITMHNFGPLMYVQAFKFSTADASKAVSYFWLSAFMFIPSAYVSDVLQVRKPISIILSLALLAMLVWWIGTFSHPLSPVGVSIVSFVFGALYSAAWAPWAAFLSEYLEDISPAVQATGWSFFLLIYRIWAAFAGVCQAQVSQNYGWAAWMWIVALATIIFLSSLLLVRGYWRPLGAESVHARPAHA